MEFEAFSRDQSRSICPTLAVGLFSSTSHRLAKPVFRCLVTMTPSAHGDVSEGLRGTSPLFWRPELDLARESRTLGSSTFADRKGVKHKQWGTVAPTVLVSYRC
jgi:hypothetical protein